MATLSTIHEIDLTNEESTLKCCERLTTYRWYESKFNNLKKHIEHIAGYASEVKPWLVSLQMINFDIFIQLNERERADGLTADEKITQTAEEQGFNLDCIHADDLHKLKRYYELFQKM
jgi:hypothetical protein